VTRTRVDQFHFRSLRFGVRLAAPGASTSGTHRRYAGTGRWGEPSKNAVISRRWRWGGLGVLLLSSALAAGVMAWAQYHYGRVERYCVPLGGVPNRVFCGYEPGPIRVTPEIIAALLAAAVAFFVLAAIIPLRSQRDTRGD
jgi:hypothetical protein